MNLKTTFLVATCITFYFQDVSASWAPVSEKELQTMTVRCLNGKVERAQWRIDNATTLSSKHSFEAEKKQAEQKFADYVEGKKLTTTVVARMIADAELSGSFFKCDESKDRATARAIWNTPVCAKKTDGVDTGYCAILAASARHKAGGNAALAKEFENWKAARESGKVAK